jgi:hypothetical protein
MASNAHADKASETDTVSADSVKRKNPVTIAVNGSDEWALRGSNPRPHGCDTSEPASQPTIKSMVTPTPSAACTSACTSEAKKAKATDLDALAAELMRLPDDERARLIAKLLANGELRLPPGSQGPTFRPA